MEGNARNPNSYEGGEDEENRQSSNTEQFVGGLLRSSYSMNGSSEQNMPPVINQMAAETEPTRQQQSDGQRQPANVSSADSYSRRNIPQIPAAEDRLARKRKRDREYRGRVKERKNQMKSTLDKLEAENGQLNIEMESLKEENVLANQQLQTQSGELEAFRNKSDELHQELSKQLENEKRMKFTLETLEAENEQLKREKESLKEENVLVNQRFDTQSKKLDELIRNNFDEFIQKFNQQVVL